MALTSNSHLFAKFHEKAFNNIIAQVMLQRPSVFNYATNDVAKFQSLCKPIELNPTLASLGVEKVTIVPKMPIVGLNDPAVGLDYCLQLKEFVIDFQPSNQIQLPPELGVLALQEFSLKGSLCAGVSCGGLKNIDIYKVDIDGKKNKLKKGISFLPVERLNMMCFCLDLFAKVVVVRENSYIKLKLVGIELQDITPLGLENSIECYLKQVLDLVIFPKLRIALSDLVFNAGDYFSLTLTPVSAAVPFNPNVSNDSISVFINII